MSLREEMCKYEQITGESAEHVPIIKLGAFLDGYEMGLKASEQQTCDEIHGSTYGGVSWSGTYTSKEQQHCEDCISREDAIKAIQNDYEESKADNASIGCLTGLANAAFLIHNVPSIKPQTLEQQTCEDYISREALLKSFKEIEFYINHKGMRAVQLVDIIDCVLDAPSVQPEIEVSENCISREALLTSLEEPMNWTDSESEIQEQRDYENFVALVKSMPLVISSSPNGNWIPIKRKNGSTIAWRCSNCGNSPKHAIKSDFCPNCGAKMGDTVND